MSTPVHVVCPHCHAANRLPQERLQEKPICGKCKQALFTHQPVELNAQNFLKHINNSDIPVVVDFWAPWCGPCKAIAPLLDQISDEKGDAAKVVKVNVDDSQELAAKYGVRSIPMLLFFKDGEAKDKVIGAGSSKDELLKKLEALA